jgi:hypothetical protein
MKAFPDYRAAGITRVPPLGNRCDRCVVFIDLPGAR